MDIKGKVVIVSGGASGLGEATVREWIARGGKAVMADVNTEAGEKLAAELGENARFAKTDVTSESDVAACIALAKEAFGQVDAFVGCAGIGTVGKVLGKKGVMALGAFQKTIDVNLVGMFNMVRLCAEAMATNEPGPSGERGVLIATASVAAYEGQIGQAAYSASKGGIVGMTLPIARELSCSGIRMCSIAPGIFATPMLAGLPEAAQESLGKAVPFPSRLGAPAEFAQLACSIAENQMLNGETIRIDGALRMAPR